MIRNILEKSHEHEASLFGTFLSSSPNCSNNKSKLTFIQQQPTLSIQAWISSQNLENYI